MNRKRSLGRAGTRQLAVRAPEPAQRLNYPATRGTCPQCNKSYALNTYGRLRGHSPYSYPCKGAGMEPK